MKTAIRVSAAARAFAAAILVALAAASPPAISQEMAPSRDPFLDRLAGEWRLVGTIQGEPVEYRATGEWLLQDGWLRLSMRETSEPTRYEAHVYLGFDAKAGDYVAHWLDGFGAAGARVAGIGTRDGDVLTLLFPYADGRFRDVLTLAADGSGGTLVIEAEQADGGWSSFASYAIARPVPLAE